MKIFFSHSSSFDYKNQLYLPIKNYFKDSEFNFFFPEEQKINTKEITKNSDLFFCELSYQSTGVAIETGWADAYSKPIFCFYKNGTTVPTAYNYLTDNFYNYSTTQELLEKIQDVLTNFTFTN